MKGGADTGRPIDVSGKKAISISPSPFPSPGGRGEGEGAFTPVRSALPRRAGRQGLSPAWHCVPYPKVNSRGSRHSLPTIDDNIVRPRVARNGCLLGGHSTADAAAVSIRDSPLLCIGVFPHGHRALREACHGRLAQRCAFFALRRMETTHKERGQTVTRRSSCAST